MPKLFCTLLLCISVKIFSQPNLVYVPVITTGLTSSIDLVNGADVTNRVFIAQQGGLIKVYDANFNYLSDFLTVTGIVSGNEQGLLSLAFHPDYEKSRPAYWRLFLCLLY